MMISVILKIKIIHLNIKEKGLIMLRLILMVGGVRIIGLVMSRRRRGIMIRMMLLLVRLRLIRI
jgi:hypothetical protein